MNVSALATKKENDSVYFVKEAKVTTSTKDNPDYYIRIRKGKFIPNNKIIAGLSNIYIADVPTPVFLPFAYFPLTQKQKYRFYISYRWSKQRSRLFCSKWWILFCS